MLTLEEGLLPEVDFLASQAHQRRLAAQKAQSWTLSTVKRPVEYLPAVVNPFTCCSEELDTRAICAAYRIRIRVAT